MIAATREEARGEARLAARLLILIKALRRRIIKTGSDFRLPPTGGSSSRVHSVGLSPRDHLRLTHTPIEPDWLTLLVLGKAVTQSGRGDDAPYLEELMWDGIHPSRMFPLPAVLNHQFMREWVRLEPTLACDHLRQSWGKLRAPDTAEEALDMLSSVNCEEAGLGEHRLTFAPASCVEDGTQWVAAPCNDCHRALLWQFWSNGSTRTWQFYPQ